MKHKTLKRRISRLEALVNHLFCAVECIYSETHPPQPPESDHTLDVVLTEPCAHCASLAFYTAESTRWNRALEEYEPFPVRRCLNCGVERGILVGECGVSSYDKS